MCIDALTASSRIRKSLIIRYGTKIWFRTDLTSVAHFFIINHPLFSANAVLFCLIAPSMRTSQSYNLHDSFFSMCSFPVPYISFYVLIVRSCSEHDWHPSKNTTFHRTLIICAHTGTSIHVHECTQLNSNKQAYLGVTTGSTAGDNCRQQSPNFSWLSVVRRADCVP